MKLHRGPVKNPVTLSTKLEGYTVEDENGDRQYIPQPHKVHRNVKKLFGVTIGKCFIGAIRWEEPEMEFGK